MNPNRQPMTVREARSAFSLIEVLVAMTILAIIVVMVAMVFQQSSLAWQSGTRRAEGSMTLRALVGFMQREMSQAVDARAFDEANLFDAGQARFVILSDRIDATARAPRLVMYSHAAGIVRRQEFILEASGGSWQRRPYDDFDLNAAMPLAEFEFQPRWGAGGTDALPLSVGIRAAVSQEGDVSSVGAWSFGPNRINENGEGDDIRSW